MPRLGRWQTLLWCQHLGKRGLAPLWAFLHDGTGSLVEALRGMNIEPVANSRLRKLVDRRRHFWPSAYLVISLTRYDESR